MARERPLEEITIKQEWMTNGEHGQKSKYKAHKQYHHLILLNK